MDQFSLQFSECRGLSNRARGGVGLREGPGVRVGVELCVCRKFLPAPFVFDVSFL